MAYKDTETPVRIYVIWHPEYKMGKNIARKIFNDFNRDLKDPEMTGIGIPVFFRCANGPNQKKPKAIPFQKADYSFIVPLIDENLVVDKEWRRYLNEIFSESKRQDDFGEGHKIKIFPMALRQVAFRIPGPLRNLNFVRWDLEPHLLAYPEIHEEEVCRNISGQLCQAICRELINLERSKKNKKGENPPPNPSPAALKLFISHAKYDGEEMALAIKEWCQKYNQVKTFFDRNDITFGYDFSNELEDALENGSAAMIALQTDAYSTREWCRFEVLKAKKPRNLNIKETDKIWGRVPMVVVNAITSGETRNFPYMGNVPTLRWDKNKIQTIVDKTMFEVLKQEYLVLLFTKIKKRYEWPEKQVLFLTHSPEPVTLERVIKYEVTNIRSDRAELDKDVFKVDSNRTLDLGKTWDSGGTIDLGQTVLKKEFLGIDSEICIVYPDPPLGIKELDFIKKSLWVNVELTTPASCSLNTKKIDFNSYKYKT
jgi:hypothetical protein